jgi:excisionase family DNA binding protein
MCLPASLRDGVVAVPTRAPSSDSGMAHRVGRGQVLPYRMKDEFYTVPVPVEAMTYSTAEAAHVLGVKRTTVYKLIIRGILKPIPHLRHKRVSKAQVHRLANGG